MQTQTKIYMAVAGVLMALAIVMSVVNGFVGNSNPANQSSETQVSEPQQAPF